MKNKHAYFAECLYNAVKGLRTNDARLIRIIVGRCEKDLGNIKMEFAQIYGHSLQTVVKVGQAVRPVDAEFWKMTFLNVIYYTVVILYWKRDT